MLVTAGFGASVIKDVIEDIPATLWRLYTLEDMLQQYMIVTLKENKQAERESYESYVRRLFELTPDAFRAFQRALQLLDGNINCVTWLGERLAFLRSQEWPRLEWDEDNPTSLKIYATTHSTASPTNGHVINASTLMECKWQFNAVSVLGHHPILVDDTHIFYHGTPVQYVSSILQGIQINRNPRNEFRAGFYLTQCFSRAAERGMRHGDAAVFVYKIKVAELCAMKHVEFGVDKLNELGALVDACSRSTLPLLYKKCAWISAPEPLTSEDDVSYMLCVKHVDAARLFESNLLGIVFISV